MTTINMPQYDLKIVKEIHKQITNFGIKLREIIDVELEKYEERKDNYTRKRKTNSRDGFCYRLLHTKKNEKQRQVTKKMNNILDCTTSNQAYVKRENELNYLLFSEVANVLTKYITSTSATAGDIIAVDGTRLYTLLPISYLGYPTNISETCTSPLITGIFDATLKVPLDLYMSNNTNERTSFINYIKEHHKKYVDKILVFDGGYFSMDILNILDEYKLNFIISVREELNFIPKMTKDSVDNLIIIKNNENIQLLRIIGHKLDKTLIDNLLISNEIKHINYDIKSAVLDKKEGINDEKMNKENIQKNIVLDNKSDYRDKNEKNYLTMTDEKCPNKKSKNEQKNQQNLIKNNKMYYITNQISDKFTIEFIINCFKKRWGIEDYFDEIKSNNKFEYIKTEKINELHKTINSNLIINYIVVIIENIIYGGICTNDIYQLNKSALYDGIYDEMIGYLLYDKITEENLSKWLNNNVFLQEIRKGRFYDRICDIPTFKWFWKKYLDQANQKKKIKQKEKGKEKEIPNDNDSIEAQNSKNKGKINNVGKKKPDYDDINVCVFEYKYHKYNFIGKIKKMNVLANIDNLKDIVQTTLKKKNIKIMADEDYLCDNIIIKNHIDINSDLMDQISKYNFEDYLISLRRSLDNNHNLKIDVFSEKLHTSVKLSYIHI